MRYELIESGRGKKIDTFILKYIPDSEIKLIEQVLNSIRGEGIGEGSVQDKYRTPLLQMRYLLDKDFMQCSRDDLKKLNAWITNSKYSSSRRAQIRTALKIAFRVWHNKEYDEDFDLIRDFKPSKMERKKSRTECLYMPEPKYLIRTDKDMDEKIIKFVKLDRDKFYFSLRWDSGGRDCEIEPSKFGDIEEENGITRIKITTGKNSGDTAKRKVPLLYSLPYLHRWKRQYMELYSIKSEDNLKDCYIFRKESENKPLTHGHYSKLCREIKKKNGIRDFSPKMFRKYCISRWERENIPDALIRKMSGHSKNSRAISHYSYHQQEDVDLAILKSRGLMPKKTEEESKPAFIVCKRCQNHNIADAESCEVCGYPLSQEKLFDYEKRVKESAKITEKIIQGNEEIKKSVIESLKKQIMEELREQIKKEMQKM